MKTNIYYDGVQYSVAELEKGTPLQPYIKWSCKIFVARVATTTIFNRPGVAGAVLQTPPSLINSFIQ